MQTDMQTFEQPVSLEILVAALTQMPKHEVLSSFFDLTNSDSLLATLFRLGVRFKDNSEDLGEEYFLVYSDPSSLNNVSPFMNTASTSSGVTITFPVSAVSKLPESIFKSSDQHISTEEWDLQFSLFLGIIEEILHTVQLTSGDWLMKDLRQLYEAGVVSGLTIEKLREHDVTLYILKLLGFNIKTSMGILEGLLSSKIEKTSWFRIRMRIHGNIVDFFESMSIELGMHADPHYLEQEANDFKLVDARMGKYLQVSENIWDMEVLGQLILNKIYRHSTVAM
jgi:hypothetical protein